jgi:multidrug transporter EmrE-like cation transporter
MKDLYYVLICVFFNVSGQYTLKVGMNKFGEIAVDQNLPLTMLKVLSMPTTVLGLSFYILGSFAWLIALSKVELSLAYPLLSIGYIIIMFVSFFLLNETMSLSKVFGTLMIVGGIIFISR